MQKIIIRNIEEEDLEQVIAFTDRWIGKNYFSKTELSYLLKMGVKNKYNASYIALTDQEIIGIRITLAPGEWIKNNIKVTPSMWNLDPMQVGYFKSLFIANNYQGIGLGKELSKKSLEQLKKMNATGVICHSWVESPNNSSQRYLKKMGFKSIKTHLNFWSDKDYECTLCGPKKCLCTADEMLLRLTN